MDSNGILNLYVDLMTQNPSNFENYLASNAVLEVFGRTIKNSRKIFEYFRYNFCEHYEHSFTQADEVPPFETRDTHMITKTIPLENLIAPPVHDEPGTSSASFSPTDTYKTPPKTPKSPQLPPLTQGRHFLDSSDESDQETSVSGTDLKIPGVNKLDDIDTPEKTVLKRTLPDEITPEHPPEKTAKISDEKLKFNIEPLPNQFSQLQYIQSSGFLKQLRCVKHRGMLNLSSSLSSHEETTPHSSTTSQSSDSSIRPTCLRLSYRVRSEDNHIQFALIIYEALNRNQRSRRNLGNEFKDIITKSNRKKTPKSTSKSGQDSSSEATSVKKSLRF